MAESIRRNHELHWRNIRGDGQRRRKCSSLDDCRNNDITVTTRLLALHISFMRAVCTVTKQTNCARNCEFYHHRLFITNCTFSRIVGPSRNNIFKLRNACKFCIFYTMPMQRYQVMDFFFKLNKAKISTKYTGMKLYSL